MADLQSPSNAGELYRYRGDEIPWTRPIFQGDVFSGVEVPGFDEGPGLVMVVTHPCSMREGPRLRPRLVVARVEPRPTAIPLPWSGNFRVMPLPDLLPGEAPGHWAANFEDLGSVRSESLRLGERVGCLDDQGVLLLQQRHTHHLTRYVVETGVLYEQCANVLAEAELLEEWLTRAVDDAADDVEGCLASATTEFDTFVGPLRNDLKDPSRRASVRRAVNQEAQRRFG